jgi:U3 small nucleolar RNA-associated protein 7
MEDLTVVAEAPSSKKYSNGSHAVTRLRTDLLPKHELARTRRRQDADRSYGRGNKLDVRSIKDKKLRRNLKNQETKFQEAANNAKDAEILHEYTPGFLEPENELEKTYQVDQDDIVQNSAIETAQKRFELKLDNLGPYAFDDSRNGRELLLGGRKGHVATMDWREGKLGCELQLGETVRDVKWLHNNQYFAVAQKKYPYIYDHNGVEIHCLRKHVEVTHMEFLPYHFLLATLVRFPPLVSKTKF